MVTAKKVRQLLSYEPETGELRWLIKPSKPVAAGTLAGCPKKSGYRTIAIDRKHYGAHRLAWLHFHGTWPESQIDHINGKKWDNRIANLRQATPAENACNKKMSRTNRVGLKGVSWHKVSKKFHAQIKYQGVGKSLGLFDSAEAAHAAYCVAAKEIHGEFHNTGSFK